MKKIVFLSLLLFLVFSTKAQYQSIFGKNSTSWNFWAVPIGASYTDSLFTRKDTLIYGKIYKQVHLNTPNVLLHIIREDTTTGSIFLSDYIHNGKELETMNMNLAKGDSFCFEYAGLDSCNALSWKKVDSIYYQNGKKIIQFDYWLPTHALPNGGTPVKWKFIEGIGPNNRGGGQRGYGLFLCGYKNGKRVFTNEAGAPCVVNTIGLNEKSIHKPKIYPNPAISYLRIELPSDHDVKYVMSTLQGIRIKEGISVNHEINVTDIKSGIYILSIHYQNQIIQTKILKQ